MHLRLGSRGSQLALWQVNHIGARLRSLGHTTEIAIIRTTGDRLQEPAFAASHAVTPEMDAKGIFIKEIEEALLAGAIDLAVHSLKDLATEMDARFALPAIPERADARDALLSPEWLQLHTLPEGARVGTTSPRRKAQMLAHRPDLVFVELRGNIDTRLRKLAAGECDALVLACAGIDRLGTRLLRTVELDPAHPEHGREAHVECVTHADHDHLADHFGALLAGQFDEKEIVGQSDWIRQRFDVETMCPAPGQGALAIETLSDAVEVMTAVATLDDASTRYAVEAERWLLHALGGGCSLPVGAWCVDRVLHGNVTAADGDTVVCCAVDAEHDESARQLGERAAAELVARGARKLLLAAD